MSTNTITEILKLLKHERNALKAGDFDTLDTLAETKNRLFEDLTRNSPAPSDLRQIKVRLSENQTLFSAAIKGVAAARDRIDALQNVREGLSVYNQSGQMAKVPTSRPAVRKKA